MATQSTRLRVVPYQEIETWIIDLGRSGVDRGGVSSCIVYIRIDLDPDCVAERASLRYFMSSSGFLLALHDERDSARLFPVHQELGEDEEVP